MVKEKPGVIYQATAYLSGTHERVTFAMDEDQMLCIIQAENKFREHPEDYVVEFGINVWECRLTSLKVADAWHYNTDPATPIELPERVLKQRSDHGR